MRAKEQMPKLGAIIDTPSGRGKVVQVNVVKESVQVELESQVMVEVSNQELLDLALPPSVPETKPHPRRRKRHSGS
jgi:cell fate regulator YaaT (PSP1 superfamily)